MIKSKTKIEKQLLKKRNPELVKTILSAKKNKGWLNVASIISSSRRNRPSLNLNEISKESKTGEIIIVPGKVLSLGELDKKLKIVALSFSEKAKEKIKKSQGEALTIMEEIKKNPDAKGVRILR